MRGLRVFLLSCLFLCTLPLSTLLADSGDDSSFVIAPPPVGYPDFVVGDPLTLVTVDTLLLRLDLLEETLTAIGISGYASVQQTFASFFSANGGIGVSVLAGDKAGFLAAAIPVDVGFVLQPLRAGPVTILLFGKGGGALNSTRFTVEVPQLVPYTTTIVEDETSVSTVVGTGVLTGGCQVNLATDRFIFSPFGSYSYSGGSYRTNQTSSMSYDYPTTSGRIDGNGSTVFGVDVLYRPKGVSLSSQLRMAESYTLFSLAVKWLLRGPRSGDAGGALDG